MASGLANNLLHPPCKLQDEPMASYVQARTVDEISVPISTPGISVRELLRLEKWNAVIVVVLLTVLYARNFVKLSADWWSDPNYSHGFLVPVVFIWLVWRRKHLLLELPVEPVPAGLLIVAVAALQLLLGILAAELFIAHTSLLLMCAGVVLYLFGKRSLRELTFPIAWLLFMIPLPTILLRPMIFQLQLLTSAMAAGTLDLFSVTNLRAGNVIYLPNFTIGIVEACSGIRSLISLIALAVLFGTIYQLRAAHRFIVVLMSIPIALGFNAVRIIGTGLIGSLGKPELAEGFFHTFSGGAIFISATLLMLLLLRLIAEASRAEVSRKV